MDKPNALVRAKGLYAAGARGAGSVLVRACVAVIRRPPWAHRTDGLPQPCSSRSNRLLSRTVHQAKVLIQSAKVLTRTTMIALSILITLTLGAYRRAGLPRTIKDPGKRGTVT